MNVAYLRREEISAWDSRIRKYEYYHHEERAARARGAAERLEGTYVVCRRRQSEDGGLLRSRPAISRTT